MNSTVDHSFKGFVHACLGPHGLWVFLLLLFIVQMIGPIIDSPVLRLMTSLLFSFFMIAGVTQLSERHGLRILGSLLVVAAIMLRWLGHLLPTPTIVGWGLTAALLFMIFLTVTGIGKVFRDDRPVTSERIIGAVAVYLVFGLTWAHLYGLIDHLLPGAFTFPAAAGIDDPAHQESFTYFSFVTLTTLGYGDIAPVHPLARMCAVIQALFGQLYPATLLARLVSLEIINRQSPPPQGDGF